MIQLSSSEPIVVARDGDAELDGRVKRLAGALEAVELQGLCLAGDGTHTASDAILGIDHGSFGVVIHGECTKEAAVDACLAHDALVAGLGHEG